MCVVMLAHGSPADSGSDTPADGDNKISLKKTWSDEAAERASFTWAAGVGCLYLLRFNGHKAERFLLDVYTLYFTILFD